MYWTGGGYLRNPEFISCMGRERIFRHQLVSDLARKVSIDAAIHVDVRQFLPFEVWLIGKLGLFPSEVGLLRIRLRAN